MYNYTDWLAMKGLFPKPPLMSSNWNDGSGSNYEKENPRSEFVSLFEDERECNMQEKERIKDTVSGKVRVVSCVFLPTASLTSHFSIMRQRQHGVNQSELHRQAANARLKYLCRLMRCEFRLTEVMKL